MGRYSLTWLHQNGEDRRRGDMHSVGPYTYAKMLEGQGCTDIKIYYNGNLIDHYIQGRSTRNISGVPDTARQLELF